ncbi:MAG: hypothetical protein GF313_17495 [Caldithrix sp.]|nr:hypothetical protein [Caldithrix sp.]
MNHNQKAKQLERHLERIQTRIKALEKRSNQYAFLRLSIAGVGLLLIIAALYFSSEWLSFAALFVLIVIFGIAGWLHGRLKKTIRYFLVWKEFKQDQLNRFRLNWASLPPSKAATDISHPFANDLHITGNYSIHRLLDICQTREGSQQLLEWLTITHPQKGAIIYRQDCIKALQKRSIFRNKLNVLPGLASEHIFDGQSLAEWLNKEAQKKAPILPSIILTSLALINIILLVFYLAGWLPPLVSLSFILYISIFIGAGRPLRSLFDKALTFHEQIEKLRHILTYLQRFRFRNDLCLQNITDALRNQKWQPSKLIQHINLNLTAIGFRMNPVMLILLNIVFPYDYWMAWHLQYLIRAGDANIPSWLSVWYQIEALSALAGFADLNQQYTFPTLDEGSLVLKCRKMGHPLIDKEQKVTNDFHVTETTKLAMITGSNMSGKSTFLRTIGVNMALTYAGTAVDAAYFEVSLFRLFTCINISDSLKDGLSYFYAEVKRLRLLLEAADENDSRPLFFLIDEIYKGTNNRERLLGSRAYIKALSQKKAAGIISTHDLELVELAESINHLINYHFEETVLDDELYFDYLIKKGPSQSTNALAIMRKEGLPTTNR